MKYVLVDKGDNIIDKVDLNSELREAKKFFIGRKRIDEREFDNMWRVMSKEQYDTQHTASLQNKQYEWWKDDQSYLDIDK